MIRSLTPEPPEGCDHYEFCCWKLEIDASSLNGCSVAHVTVHGVPTVPIYFP